MNTKLNNINRYKKVSRDKIKNGNKFNYKNKSKKVNKDLKKNSTKNIKNLNDNKNIYTPSKLSNDSKKVLKTPKTINNENKKSKSKSKKYTKFNSKFIIVVLVFIVISVSILSRIIVKQQNSQDNITVFSNKETGQKLQKDYNLSIGISKLDTMDLNITNNIILNEIILNTKSQLLTINKDYSIDYKQIDKIEQINDTRFLITLKKDTNIKYENIKNSIDEIKNIGEKNIYYNLVKNISSVESNNKQSFYINLLTKDPYFIYKLTFPISVDNKSSNYNISDKQQNSIMLTRNKFESSISSIKINDYEDTDVMVDDFRNNNLDIFVASSNSIMQLIGKHEYNIKKYRDGETIFLLGNKESNLFKLKEVRQALAYSINRDEIIRKINMGFSEVIDLPYIYSNIKYKYDLYGAQNILLANGWKNTGGIYNKNSDFQYKKLEMSLLVNNTDNTKIKIAEYIKEMVEQIGIKINIEQLSQEEILGRINEKKYDLVLADVYINDNPDISYLEEYLNINDITNEAFEKVKNSDSSNIVDNITYLQDTLSNEIACIGIMAKNVNVVYQKYITGFDDLGYMKVFNFNNIGRIEDDE